MYIENVTISISRKTLDGRGKLAIPAYAHLGGMTKTRRLGVTTPACLVLAAHWFLYV